MSEGTRERKLPLNASFRVARTREREGGREREREREGERKREREKERISNGNYTRTDYEIRSPLFPPLR